MTPDSKQFILRKHVTQAASFISCSARRLKGKDIFRVGCRRDVIQIMYLSIGNWWMEFVMKKLGFSRLIPLNKVVLCICFACCFLGVF